MAVCPKCSTDNEDVDFCVNCGTYLRWDPTRLQPAVKLGDLNPAPPAEPEAPAAAAPAAPPEAAPPAEPAAPPPSPAAAPPPPPPPAAEPPPPAVDIPVPAMRTMDMPVVRAGQPLPPGMENMPNLVTPEAVQITPTYPELPGEEQKLIVEAGGHAHLPTLVRNQSGIVDNYEIQVRGMPDGWWNVTPPSVYLVPFGAPSGTYEQDVQINFSPPRSAEAEARLWQLEVVAVSRAQGEVAGSTKIQVQITPYEEIESELRPELVTGRRRGEFALMVRNRANAPLDIVITAVDTQNALAFDFAKSQFTAEPGRRDGTTFSAKAKKHHWIGRPNDKRFEVYSRAATGQSTAKPLTGVFRQKPWIPYWVPIVVPAIIAGAALLYSLIPHKTTVPALRGRSAAAAAVILQKAHLKAPSPPFKEVPSSHIPAGFVVSQSPKAGSHVKNGTAVTFTVAEPLVPNLAGLTPAQAKIKLQQKGLLLGSPVGTEVSTKKPGLIIKQLPGAGTNLLTGKTVLITIAVGNELKTVPEVEKLGLQAAAAAITQAGLTEVPPSLSPGQDPTKVTISLQVPAAGTKLPKASAVTVYVNAPPPPPTTTTTKAVPAAGALAGLGGAAAAAAVKAAGATPVLTQQFNAAKIGTVVGTNPAQVKAGQTVQIIVSAGLPPIAYSDGKSIYTMDATNGKSVKIAASGDTEDEPTWQPNGSLVAYRRGPSNNANAGKIWMVDLAKGGTSARDMTAGPDDRRPAFAPNGKTIAFIRRTTSGTTTDGDLCFVTVGSTLHQGVCIKDPKFNVDRPTWSADGRAILVVVPDPVNANQIELGEYTTATPFSANTRDWVWQGLVTDKMHGTKPGEGILYAAFSPDGSQVALVANWGGDPSVFKIFLAPWSNGQLGTPKAVAPAIRACEVSWLADGSAIVVTQADNCNAGSGSIVRVSPSDSATQTQLRASGGQNPWWKYLTPP